MLAAMMYWLTGSGLRYGLVIFRRAQRCHAGEQTLRNRKLKLHGASQAQERSIADDLADSEVGMYRIILLHRNGSFSIANGRFTQKQAREWVKTWDSSLACPIACRERQIAKLLRSLAFQSLHQSQQSA